MTTGTFVVFSSHVFSISISRSLFFESFATVFKEVFFFIWDRHIDEQAGPLLLVFHFYVWFVCLDFFLSVWTGMSPSIVTALFFIMVIARLHCDILAVIKLLFFLFPLL